MKVQAVSFDADFKFWPVIKAQSVDCILVDEAQFLTKSQVLELVQVVDRLKIPVLTYGLRSDFQAKPFEGSLYLLVWADVLEELKTICACGKKATHNLRLDAKGRAMTQGEQVLIGGNERYEAVCRQHFYEKLALADAPAE